MLARDGSGSIGRSLLDCSALAEQADTEPRFDLPLNNQKFTLVDSAERTKN